MLSCCKHQWLTSRAMPILNRCRMVRGGTAASKSKSNSYSYDAVYEAGSSQECVFADVQPVVTSVMDGYNVCIFAYGQTGTALQCLHLCLWPDRYRQYNVCIFAYGQTGDGTRMSASLPMARQVTALECLHLCLWPNRYPHYDVCIFAYGQTCTYNVCIFAYRQTGISTTMSASLPMLQCLHLCLWPDRHRHYNVCILAYGQTGTSKPLPSSSCLRSIHMPSTSVK